MDEIVEWWMLCFSSFAFSQSIFPAFLDSVVTVPIESNTRFYRLLKQ